MSKTFERRDFLLLMASLNLLPIQLGMWRNVEKRMIGANEAKKCQKMRNEATTLLKTKEVDWERTQTRSQFEGVFGLNRLGLRRLDLGKTET